MPVYQAKAFGKNIFVKDFSNRIIQKFRTMANRKMRRIMRYMQAFLQAEFRETKHGQYYYIPGTNKVYQASAPGEYPAIRTGDMDRSLNYQITVTGENVMGVIGVVPEYALTLEGFNPGAHRPLLKDMSIATSAGVRQIMEDPKDFS